MGLVFWLSCFFLLLGVVVFSFLFELSFSLSVEVFTMFRIRLIHSSVGILIFLGLSGTQG